MSDSGQGGGKFTFIFFPYLYTGNSRRIQLKAARKRNSHSLFRKDRIFFRIPVKHKNCGPIAKILFFR